MFLLPQSFEVMNLSRSLTNLSICSSSLHQGLINLKNFYLTIYCAIRQKTLQVLQTYHLQKQQFSQLFLLQGLRLQIKEAFWLGFHFVVTTVTDLIR